MITISLIDNVINEFFEQTKNKKLLQIIRDIFPHINQSKIDQEKSNFEIKDKSININFYSNNNICCPIYIASEDDHVTIIIGIGEVNYLDNASILKENDAVKLKSCIRDLFYLPVIEDLVYKNGDIISSTCLINQSIDGKVMPIKYKHVHKFSFLPLSKTKVSYNFNCWIE